MSKRTERIWRKLGLDSVLSSDDGVFYFKFDSFSSRDVVLEQGPWRIANQPIIIGKWQRMLKVRKDNVKSIPFGLGFTTFRLNFGMRKV